MSTKVIDSRLAVIAIQRFNSDPLIRLQFSNSEEFYKALKAISPDADASVEKATEILSPDFERMIEEVQKISSVKLSKHEVKR